VRLLALLFGVAALVVAVSSARAASIRVESGMAAFPDPSPGTPGTLTFGALLTDFAIVPEALIRVTVGSTQRWIRLFQETPDAVAARGVGDTFSYSRRSRRLRVTMNGVLAGGENPVVIELLQGQRVVCTMIQFGVVTDTQWSFGGSPQFPCVFRDAPRVDPTVIPAGKATTVRFAVPLGPRIPPDGRRARLVRVDNQLAPIGRPLCELREGAAATLACDARLTLTERDVGWFGVRAEGTYSGIPIASPSTWVAVPAAEPPADASSTTTTVPPSQ